MRARRNLRRNGRNGLDVNGEKLFNLRFADDVVLFVKNKQERTETIIKLDKERKKARISINFEKELKF